MINFEHTRIDQRQFEELAKLLFCYENCSATSKFDLGKVEVELKLPLKARTSSVLENKALLEYLYNYRNKHNICSIS